MELRILAVGDVVGLPGLSYLSRHLRSLKQLYKIDFCVVNGENANGVGILPRQADLIFDAGATSSRSATTRLAAARFAPILTITATSSARRTLHRAFRGTAGACSRRTPGRSPSRI